MAPVDERGVDLPGEIAKRIRARKCQGVVIVIARCDRMACDRGGDAHKANARANLDGTATRSLVGDDEVGQNGRRWPQLGPVRQSLIPIEIALADEILRTARPQNVDVTAANADVVVDGNEASLEICDKLGACQRSRHAGKTADRNTESRRGMARNCSPG